MQNQQYAVYIITNRKNGTLYTGSTNNLSRRVWEHKNKLWGKFSSKYNCDKLVYFESGLSWEGARMRERQIKKWKRAWKLELIEGKNSDWKDLYEDVG